jgi:sporulation protein YlmC with PRC-barrel domain
MKQGGKKMTPTTVLDRATALKSRSLKDLQDYRILATDGEIGTITDFYLDDRNWKLRYFVVETGSWINTRHVLVSPTAFTDSDGTRRTIVTTLTRKQIEEAPHADLAQPVSRQFEVKLHEHFAWPMYWRSNATESRSGNDGDPHLRSVNEVLGYGIRAQDGEIGHVEDLVVEERTWLVRYLAIDTRNWLPGRKVLVSPWWIDDVSWPDRRVTVGLRRRAIENSPRYDPSQPVNRAYEEKLYDYYGRPRYWA